MKNVLAEDSIGWAERILNDAEGSVAVAIMMIAVRSGQTIGGADLTDIAGNRGNVSRARENRFREAVGLALRPKVVEVEVQEGERVKVLAERRERARRPRWNVPADNVLDLAIYLEGKLTYEQRKDLIDYLYTAEEWENKK